MRADFDDLDDLDQFSFAVRTLSTSGFSETSSPVRGWRAVGSGGRAGVVALRGPSVLGGRRSPWKSVVAALALHRVIRLQRGVFFFHAAAVGLGGRGVLMVGPKEVGKTTLSLALAERGHAFLSDEISVLRQESLELLPFRRRLSIRPGPSAAGVRRLLSRGPVPMLHLADGTSRYLVPVAEVCPGQDVAPVAAAALVFLGPRGSRPRLERFTPGVEHLGLLTPLESVAWSMPRSAVALRLLRLLGRLPCYALNPGPIPDTVGVLEDLMEV